MTKKKKKTPSYPQQNNTALEETPIMVSRLKTSTLSLVFNCLVLLDNPKSGCSHITGPFFRTSKPYKLALTHGIC